MREDEHRSRVEGEKTEGDLREIVGEYETRLRDAVELASHVRHEINNPLTGLLGHIQLLGREQLSETARQRLSTMEEQAHRIRLAVIRLDEIVGP